MGRPHAWIVLAAIACVWMVGVPLAAAPQVSVTEKGGLYQVSAGFTTPQPPAVVMGVLTDYEQIPTFLPNVTKSVVLERTPGRVVVEQEATARFMLFSKHIHLELEVREEPGAITFIDRSGKSFLEYRGAWHIAGEHGRSAVTYELTARPAFDVPAFVLRRLLGRDASQMIEKLKAEMAARQRVT